MSLIWKFGVGRLVLFGAVCCLLSTVIYRGHTTSTFVSEPERIGSPQASSICFTPIAENSPCRDGSSNTACGIKLTQSGFPAHKTGSEKET